MSLILQQHTEDYHWAIWKIDELEEELISLLPHNSRYYEAISHFKAPTRRLEYLSVRALLFRMLNEEKTISHRENGKPYLDDNSYHISISHTRGYAAVIISKQHEVGIDIEQFGRRVEKVASHYMRSDEIPQPYEGDCIWSLLLHWSAKEVMYKCMDATDVDFIRHLRIAPFTPLPSGEFNAQEFRSSQCRIFHIQYQLHPEYVMTFTCL
jgi:4'-phosphopantetheinyl transferase